jgi:hypothetical protein
VKVRLMNSFLRFLGMVSAAIALVASFYMATIASQDWIVRHELKSESGTQFGNDLCQEIRGCLTLTVEPKYDWASATVLVTYHIKVAPGGAKGDELAGIVKRMVDAQTGVLGLALRASGSSFDVTTPPIPRKAK